MRMPGIRWGGRRLGNRAGGKGKVLRLDMRSAFRLCG